MDEALFTVGSLGLPEIIQVGTQRSSFICRHGYLFGFGLHRHWKGQNARFLRRRESAQTSMDGSGHLTRTSPRMKDG